MVIGNLHFPRRCAGEAPAAWRHSAGRSCGRWASIAACARRVADLPVGQLQLLAIARALSMDARIILMDEPTSSLFDDAAERLFGLIAALKERGVSVVYVSHKMDEIFRISRPRHGAARRRNRGTVETAASTPAEIIRMMVGRDLQLAVRAASGRAGEVVLRVEKLTTRKLRGVCFELRRGEVLGVAGLVGAGAANWARPLCRAGPHRRRTDQMGRRSEAYRHHVRCSPRTGASKGS